MRGAGALLLIAAFFLFGLNAVREKRAHIHALRELAGALELFSAELALHTAPIPEAVSSTAHLAVGKGRELFRVLSRRLCCLGEESFAQLWSGAVRLSCGELSSREREELETLGASLGRYDLDTQLRELRACCAFLSARREEAEQALPAERRLWLGLSASAGAFLAILLL